MLEFLVLMLTFTVALLLFLGGLVTGAFLVMFFFRDLQVDSPQEVDSLERNAPEGEPPPVTPQSEWDKFESWP